MRGVRNYRHQLGYRTMVMHKSELLDSFENFIQCLPGFERIDVLLSGISEGRRADYAFSNRRILIEQKYTQRPSARHKRESIEALFEQLTGEPHHDIGQILDKMDSLIPDIRQQLTAVVNRKTNFVQKMFSAANEQIGSTVGLLNLGWAHGVLAILNDHVNGEVHPKEIFWRAKRELQREEDGRRRYGNILSVFVLSHHSQTKSLFSNSFDMPHIGSAESLIQLAPVAAMISNFYNSAIPNRTGPVEGEIPPSVSWPLTN